MLGEKDITLFQSTNLAKFGLGLLLVFFLSFLFPSQSPFSYQYQLGETWNHETILAPYDITLEKNQEDSMDSIGETIRAELPLFFLDTNVIKQKRSNFLEAFTEQVSIAEEGNQFPNVVKQADPYREFAEGFIDRKYKKGIISPLFKHGKASGDRLNLRVGKRQEELRFADLDTPAAIEAMIGDSLFYSGLEEAEFLIPLLSGIFRPNVRPLQPNADDPVFVQKNQMILAGEIIVAKGSSIDETTFLKINAFQEKYESKSTKLAIFVGHFIMTSLLIGLFLFFLMFNYPTAFDSFRHLLFLLLWFIIYGYLVYLLEQNQVLSIYVLPFCIVPIVVKVFFKDRLALFLHILVILLASMISSEDYEFIFIQILAGAVVVLGNIEVRNWSRFFLSTFYVFMAYTFAYLGLSLLNEGAFLSISLQPFSWLFISVFLTLLAYPLIPLLERVFGFTSAISLMELSDMNRPLLKELSIKAPGTLQHSLQVGNLSEAAAAAIGADTLLVKVAALYHDIGKIPRSNHFIENQSRTNPHDELSEVQSAKIIIDHVSEGEQMARKAGLPQVIINFIRSHHGDTRVEYFYQKFIKNHPGRQLDESLFHYPGPKPKTKEETILMLADSLEAACKSLQNPNEQDLNDRVEKVVAGKIRMGQLIESEITFQELEICVEEFKKMLKSIHHIRIEYPE